MVFFNCNACGEALKKNQVEKHTLRCRQCAVLACVDCGKDFWGNDYQTHTKCMSENEKYCGKGYVPKVNKGEVKQEQWIEKVQNAIEKSATNPRLKDLLERLKDYPNIPRKKQKFENFLKNSLRIMNHALISQVWETLMAAAGQNEESKQKQQDSSNKSENGVTLKTDSNSIENGVSNVEEEDCENNNHRLSKREKKEERRKNANKKEKKDKTKGTVQEVEKKSKKRKLSITEEESRDENAGAKESLEPEVQQKRKKKKHNSELQEQNGVERNKPTEEAGDKSSDDEGDEEDQKPKKKKKRFNWEATVIAVLESKGEMSLKKLRKKVLSEFVAQDAANYSEENLKAKFDKKIKKLAKVKVFKDRVKLK
ncbi:unnamed protein product [Lymnaea stagnalis]|uniref:Cell growth-regulating nucleolar protein n=1 Tax=Lymnaea stagnalis TaxID=6523 RepID=A0AAV2H8B6_LYMST